MEIWLSSEHTSNIISRNNLKYGVAYYCATN